MVKFKRLFKKLMGKGVVWSTLFFITIQVQAQTDSMLLSADTTYSLEGDTLFSNQDFKMFIGQKVIVGKGSGERDWYATFSFKSGASWPLLFLKETETQNNVEYQLDPAIRERDKVKGYLVPGDTLTVTKIKRYGKKRNGYWYMVDLSQGQSLLSLRFKCDIINAIKLKEVLLAQR
jgi:hypothetical protein